MKSKKLLGMVLGAMMMCSAIKAHEITPGKVVEGVVCTGAGVASLGGSFYAGLFSLACLKEVHVVMTHNRSAEDFWGYLVGSAVLGFVSYGLLKLGTFWIDSGLRKMGILKAKSQQEQSAKMITNK
jgi:hypothetical protein